MSVTPNPIPAQTTMAELFPEVSQSAKLPLVVIGDTGVDLMVSAPELPGADDKVIGQHVGIFGGGMAANFAVSAKRFAKQVPVELVSRVGGDMFGVACRRDLETAGIDTSHVHVETGGVTWWCAVILNQSGEKSLIGARTSASLPKPTDLSPALLSSARWVHVLADVSFSEEAVCQADSERTIRSVDIEASFVRDEPTRARKLIELADLSILNANALSELANHEARDYESCLRGMGRLREREGWSNDQSFLVTLGAFGSVFAAFRGDRCLSQFQPAKAVSVADSTGAGDSFAGAFVGSLLSGETTSQALSNAALSAEQTLQVMGARGHELPMGISE